ncbi:MAG: glycosyltransferase [Nitrospira sp.]|nr:glycosyltransferase [Nitrospira sp.]
MDATPTRLSYHDRIGLGILALLLLSPIVFKVSVTGSVVIHPFVPLLAMAWLWVAWTIRQTFRVSRPGMWRMEWQTMNLPMVLFGGTIGALGFSVVVNGLRFEQSQTEGWLLLVKWILYMAPLPLTTLLATRTGPQTLRLIAWSIPLVALVTLGYSALRLQQSTTGSYYNAYFEQKGAFFAMGMFGELLSTHGLTVRLETASHGAYGMYLVLVLAFSVSLAIFRGWNGIVPSWYAVAQGLVVGPLLLVGLLWTGSRSSLIFCASVMGIYVVLLVVNPSKMVSWPSRLSVLLLMMILPLGLFVVDRSAGPMFPTLKRMQGTAVQRLDLQATLLGINRPDFDTDTRVDVTVRNVQSRVWLWGQTVRYMVDHPMTLVTGLGYDRRRFVEEVVRLPYVGTNKELRTAHNLYLDVIVKGGIGSLFLFLLACLWLFWTALTCILVPVQNVKIPLVSIGWVLLSVWPSLLVVSVLGEDMVTDNLMLHWTMLFGLALGLRGTAIRSSLPRQMVHLSATAGLGGGPVYVTAVACHQLQQGTRVRIFCSDEKPYVDIWREMGVDVTVLPMRVPQVRTIRRLVTALLKAPAPVHAHGRGAAFFALWIKLLLRIPVIYTPHGPHYAFARGWKFVSAWCVEYVFRVVFDSVLYVSKGEQELARSLRLPMRGSRTVLSSLMRPPDDKMNGAAPRSVLRQEVGLDATQIVIGWIGRFHYQKGLDIFLESIPDVARHVPQAVWLVIGDGEPGEIERYREQLTQRGLSDRVRFLGARTDAYRLAQVFDMYVSTSRWEGLPLVLLEVMDGGVAIAASDVVGNHDVLEGWGFLFQANDAAAAAEAQIALARDVLKREALVAHGRRVLQERFVLPRMLQDLDRAYDEVLGERASA